MTFTYVSSAHEGADGTQFGPGQSDYVAQLKQYDQDFGTFFKELTDHGITPANTLFFVGSDENEPAKGLISILAPLARTLIGKSVGDTVTAQLPGGKKTFEILKANAR